MIVLVSIILLAYTTYIRNAPSTSQIAYIVIVIQSKSFMSPHRRRKLWTEKEQGNPELKQKIYENKDIINTKDIIALLTPTYLYCDLSLHYYFFAVSFFLFLYKVKCTENIL